MPRRLDRPRQDLIGTDKTSGCRVVSRADEYSIWVEILGPKGVGIESMTPDRARHLAELLRKAADTAEGYDQ